MCGIAGVWRNGPDAVSPQMLEHLHPRGPDARGEWFEKGAPWLGHTRLSILDLSDAGAQPMQSPSGRYVLTFNGEVYDHLRHRAGLDVAWRGHSDTETIAALCDAFGVEAALRRLSGMLALGVWDRDERVLWLARDRFGKKPLMWSRLPDGLAFASDLSALGAVPGVAAELDPTSVRAMLERMAVPDDRSILQGTHKVPPGCLLRFGEPDAEPNVVRLHDLYETALRARVEGVAAPPDLDALDEVLRTAVADRLLADVPLGAFLSGGIDSSVVVALMKEVADDVRTFTIGFEEATHDEAPHARAVAEHLGTDHTERYMRPEDALSVVEDLARVYDEPFADSSQLPTLLLCRETRKHVTVALSGDGGDELFGGYARYTHAKHLDRARLALPGPLGTGAGKLLRMVPPGLWNRVGRVARGVNSHRMERVADLLVCKTTEDLYERLLCSWPEARDALVDPGEDRLAMVPKKPGQRLPRMMLADTIHYLRDDILVKVDRAAMSVGLEVRCPMLDPRVYKTAWQLPDRAKVQGGIGKLPLRALLGRRVPEKLWNRPKQGFGIPVAQWLRGPLASWAEDLIEPQRLRRQGILKPVAIQRLWEDHQRGKRNHQDALWSVLMLQSWLEVHRPELSE